MFWSTKQIFDFIHDASNVIDHEDNTCKTKFEELCRINDCPVNWRGAIDDVIWQHLSQHRPYVETNYIHLLRGIRNLREHWTDIKKHYPKIYDFFGGQVVGIWNYFEVRFPKLLYNVWQAINKLQLTAKLDEE